MLLETEQTYAETAFAATVNTLFFLIRIKVLRRPV